MFSIKVATPEQLPEAELYLDMEIKGFAMLCYEQSLTGAVAFNICNGGAYIEKLKTDKPEMEYVVLASALNFLDLHGIWDVYTNLKEYEQLLTRMRFVKVEDGPIDKKDGYLSKVDLRGYFTSEKH
ncbi:MAG: hypothetical protein IJC89_05390 [Clostridia bacterium]|nr:hypothetical protein [Clostridia bacterium]